MPLSLHFPPSLSQLSLPPSGPSSQVSRAEARCQGISHMLEWKGLPERWGPFGGCEGREGA